MAKDNGSCRKDFKALELPLKLEYSCYGNAGAKPRQAMSQRMAWILDGHSSAERRYRQGLLD